MTAQGSGQTVLVVDDDASIRSALVRALSAHGWAVRTCADGQEALGLLAFLVTVDGRADSVMSLEVSGGRVTAVYIVRNPHKLTLWR